MDQRLKLHEKLKAVSGPKEVYFQPPANVQMEFPCIVYKDDTRDTKFAGNHPYLHTRRWEVTVIDRNPDSQIPDQIAAFPMCVHSTSFAADNLNHYVFTLYF